jgi:hypothetical protein
MIFSGRILVEDPISKERNWKINYLAMDRRETMGEDKPFMSMLKEVQAGGIERICARRMLHR